MESTESGGPAASELGKISNFINVNNGTSVLAGHLYQVNGLDEPMLERLLDTIDERRRNSGAVRRKSLPSSLPWTQRTACLGRARELAELRRRLAAGRHVLVGGPAGIGKTLFLQHAAGAGVLSAGTVPGCEGVLRRVLAPGTTPDEVLHDLALECYDAEPVAARRLLGHVRALVVLDGVEWAAGGIRQVLDAMPGSVFVLAARRADSASLVKSLPLSGLSRADALDLWENELGTPLSTAEKRRAERIYDSCDGNPGTLTQFAAALRTAGVRGIAPDVADPDAYAMIVDRALAKLGEPAVTTLRELLVFPEAWWGAGLLGAAGLRKLVGAGLVEHESGRYRVRPHVPEAVAPADPPWPLFARVSAWAHETGDAGQLTAELDVLERTLRRLLAHDRPWDALVLARVVSVKLLPTPWWHRGDEVLGLGLRAARRTGSRTDIAYFTYALAARRADSGQVAEAAELLTALIDSARAHDDRRLADRAGALHDGLVRRAPGLLGRGADTVSQLVLRVPVLNSAAGAVAKLAQGHPAEVRNAVAGVLLLAGVLFGLPASAGSPASAGDNPGSPFGFAAPVDPPGTSAPPAAGEPPFPPSPAAEPSVAGTVAPVPAAGGAPQTAPPGSRPDEHPGPSAGNSAGSDYRYTAAPDLTGDWELDFTRTNFGGIWLDKKDVYTITLRRLDDSRCGGRPPCYGGQWVHGDHTEGNSFVAEAFPAPIGFLATETDVDGTQQTYRGALVSDDTRQVQKYQGDWSGSGGRTATFFFTRLR